jgi:ABC-type glycerol-3-phosphate transport system permease component
MRLLNKSLIYIGLCLLSLVFVFPILWMAVTALKQPVDASEFWVWTTAPQWQNFADAWNTAGFSDAFLNTFEIGIGTVLVSLLAGLPMAYSLVRYTLRGKEVYSSSIILLRILPEMVFLLPLYVIYRKTGLFDTKLGMVLAFQILTLPYAVWLLRSFVAGVPEELENAARIDGCSEFELLWRITFPLILPGVVTVSILTFITVWTSLMFPLTLAYSKAQTVAVAISSFKGYGTFNWPIMAAAALCVTVPQIFMFSFINKYLVAGYTMGAVKE